MRLPRLLVGRRQTLFASLIGNGVAQGVLAVLTAVLVMRIFDGIGATSGPVALWFAGAAAAVVATAWLRRSERVSAERLGQHYVRAVRGRLYRRLLTSSARPQRRPRKGKVLLRFVGDLSALRRWISLGLARLVVAGIAVSIALSALLWLHWPFAAGVTAILTLAGAWILYRAKDLRRAIATTRRRQASLAANVTEKLNGVRAVQAFGQAAHEHRVLRRQSARLATAAVEQAGRIGGLRGVIDATAGGCVLVVLALAYLQPPGDLSPGMLAAVLSIIGFLTPPLRELGRAQEYWLASRVARANLLSLAQTTQRLAARSRRSPLRIDRGAITLRDVGMRGLFSGLNVQAPGGSRIALTGANGSGKSTLLGLIGRLFDPHEGAVVIDGQDISRVQLASLRRQLAYVGADVPLIGGTLRRCLCYGAGRVDDERLQQVLRDCELERVVARLDGGLAGRIGEGGSNLSQGERLRVALARALLRQPRILLLDEPDANLDAQAVRALNRTIAGFAGTVLLATHRSSSLISCDVVWQLHDGKLQQQIVQDRHVAASASDALTSVGPGAAASR